MIRVTKRTDLAGRAITPKPLFNHGPTRMKYRYEYLAEDFDTGRPYGDLRLPDRCVHKDLPLDQLFYTPCMAKQRDPVDAMFAGLEPPQKDSVLQMDLLTGRQKTKLRAFLKNNGLTDPRLERLGELSPAEFDQLFHELLWERILTPEQFRDIYTIVREAGT